jgi:hypothetical protein
MTNFTWARYADVGYEVSSRGDTRFSPLYAVMPDGRTIEVHYQCDVKGFNPGGENWRTYKGRKVKDKTREQLWDEFLGLWRTWAEANPRLLRLLAREACQFGGVLTDQFASTEINQARALSTLLNEWSEA